MRLPTPRIAILWIYLVMLLSRRVVVASFWNWLITNPHDVEVDTVAVVRKAAQSASSTEAPLVPFAEDTSSLHVDEAGRPRTSCAPHAVSSGKFFGAARMPHRPRTSSVAQKPNASVRSVQVDQSSPIDFLSPADENQANDQTLLRHRYVEVICQRDRDCRVGEFCDLHYGVCKRYKGDKQPCRTDGQCASGLDCMFGRCRPVPKPGYKGARCTSSRDCLQGLCCARQHGSKVCKPKLKFGQKCFIPDGGLSYWLNEICSCESGLVCGFVQLTHNTTEAVPFDRWNGLVEMRCKLRLTS